MNPIPVYTAMTRRNCHGEIAFSVLIQLLRDQTVILRRKIRKIGIATSLLIKQRITYIFFVYSISR